MKRESTARWPANGLPRKGWTIMDSEDTGKKESACEWCGTGLRYIFHLEHPEGLTTTCGCVCAEHLCKDYERPREMLKKCKAETSKREREERKRLKAARLWREHLEELRVGLGWRQSEKGNWWVGLPNRGIVTVFRTKDNAWKWVCNSVFADRDYPTPEEAQKAFMDHAYPAS